MTKSELQQRKKSGGIVSVRDRGLDRPYASFGEFLQGVRGAASARSVAEVDPRLFEWQRRALGASGASEQVPADGGFLVGAFAGQLIERLYLTGEILSRCTEIPITGANNRLKLPKFAETSRANGSRLGGVSVNWVNEGSPATKAKPQFALSELVPRKLIGLIYTTDELMQDAAALDQFTTRAFAEEMNFVLEDSIISGPGVTRPLGILNSPALITVGEEAGQSAASILYENVQKMWGRCWAPSRKNSVWLINQDAEPQLLGMRVHNAAATDFVGGPIYIAEGTAETAPYPALFGRPVIPVEHCSTVGTVGDIILADFTRYILATRAPSNVVSLHVNFVEDEALFRFVMRVDGQAIDATPITPLNGTDTKSPFVVLGTRA